MQDHNCPHEGLILQSHKELYGNSREGVVSRLIKTEQKTEEMGEDFKLIKTALRGIEKARGEELAITVDRDKRSKKQARRVGIIGGIFALILSADKIIDLIQKIGT